MSQMCKNWKGNVVKQGGKNKFYATSLLHPCMRHLVSPGTISPSCAGNCQDRGKLFNLCVGNAYPRNDQSCFAKFSVEPVWVLTEMVIAAGSHCWEWGGNLSLEHRYILPWEEQWCSSIRNSYFGNVLIPWTFDSVSGSAREQSQGQGSETGGEAGFNPEHSPQGKHQ